MGHIGVLPGGGLVNPIAEIALVGYGSGLVGSTINESWLSVIKYAHSVENVFPDWNLVSKVDPGAAEMEKL